MQAAAFRNLDHLAERRKRDRSADGRIFFERQMRTASFVVFEIRLQDATQAWFIQDDAVVQALAANRSDQSLDIGILPRRSRSREDVANAQPASRFVKFLSVAREAGWAFATSSRLRERLGKMIGRAHV